MPEVVGGRLVFVCADRATATTNLCVMNMPTSAVAQITHFDSERVMDPAWAPDMSKIVFALQVKKAVNIFTIRPDGSDLTQLTAGSGERFSPSWSPEGSRIMYLKRAKGGASMVVVESDGTGVIRTVPLKGKPTTGLFWSPDGSRVAYCQGPGVYVARLPNLRSGSLLAGKRSYCGVSWAPNARKVLFMGVQSRGSLGIYVAAVKGGQSRLLVRGAELELVEVTPGPDSHSLVVTSDGAEGLQLFLHPLENGPEVQLTHGAGSAYAPDWGATP